MSEYFVIGGKSSEKLSKNIAKKLNAKFIKTSLKVFPDGESKITLLDSLGKGTIIVVSSTGPPVDSNLIHILSLISKAREKSSDVIAVVPYMGYAKQDKEFLEGEIITISVVAKLLKSAGATKLIVVDFHSKDALKFFKIPTKNISAIPLFAKYLKRQNLKNPLIVSPDLFWKDNAKELATYLNTKSIALNKQRNRKTGKLVIKPPFPKFSKGCDLILFDDMISTGSSMLKTINLLKKKSFRKIFAVCTHPVFAGDAEKKIKNSGISKIIGTNSIEGKFSKIDLSELISKTIQSWK